MREIFNITEEMIWVHLRQAIAKGQCACTCDICLTDIMTYSLNRLPPNYVSRKMGAAIKGSGPKDTQLNIDIIRVLSEAIELIGKHPNHDEPPLDEAVTAASGYLCTCNTDLALTFISGPASLFMGYQPWSMLNKNISEFMHPNYREALAEGIINCMSKKSHSTLECIVVRRDSSQYLVKLGISPIFEDEEPVGALILFLHLSRIDSANTPEYLQLQDSVSELQELEKIRSNKFLSDTDLEKRKNLGSHLAEKFGDSKKKKS
ncbi:MAG: late competence development ComFB family protein [Candidatus Saccharibacteria bacterium]